MRKPKSTHPSWGSRRAEGCPLMLKAAPSCQGLEACGFWMLIRPTAARLSPDLSRVQNVLGVEELLDAFHQLQGRAVFLPQVLATPQTDARLARGGAADRVDE